MSTAAPDAELLAAYLATHWTVEDEAGGSFRVCLNERVPPGAPLRPGGILTAFNPASEWRPAAQNEAANRALEAALRAAGALLLPCMAHPAGPDAARWREPGYAARGIPRSTAVALGERFGQNAIVWVDAAGWPALVVTRSGFCGRRPGDVLHAPLPASQDDRQAPHEP